MTKEDIFEKLQVILAEAADVEKEEILSDSQLMYDVGLSSVEVLSVLVMIEKEFSIRVPEKAIRTFVTVQDIVDYVASQVK